MSKEVKRYAKRDIIEMDRAGNYYCRHVSAMTGEGLHDKSDIAAELGWRDQQIEALLAERDRMAKALKKIIDAECKSSPTATDFGISWDRGMLIGTMKDIARAALQGEQP